MADYDKDWFGGTLLGGLFTELTDLQYGFVLPLAQDELRNVLCWCPLIYPQALSMRIAILLDGLAMGTHVDAQPTLVGHEYEAIIQEDEVFDTRRKFKIVERNKQLASANVAGQLQGIIDRCKRPLAIGATLSQRLGGCCGSIADKTVLPYGH